LTRTGFIDHIGIGVPDLAAAKDYYDELMPILGLREWFKTRPGGPFNYGPDGARDHPVLFLPGPRQRPTSRPLTGLHQISFMVASRATVRESHGGPVATRRSSCAGRGSSPSTAPTSSPPTGSIPTA
jgi:catechol 2,3-dioxygenase-like lactoylglutathione lyase family enzyme